VGRRGDDQAGPVVNAVLVVDAVVVPMLRWVDDVAEY
jgi:hypothetical protein